MLRTASSLKRSGLNRIKVSPRPGHCWLIPLPLRMPFLKHFSFRPSPLFLWMVIWMMKLLKVEYKNRSILKTYRSINQLGAVYFFQTYFPENMFIKIQINVLPTNSLNCQEYADNIWWPESGQKVAGERLRNRSFICEPPQCGVWKIYSHPHKSLRGWCVSLHSLRYTSAKGMSLIFLLNACLVFHGLLRSPFVSHSQIDGQREVTDQRVHYLPLC